MNDSDQEGIGSGKYGDDPSVPLSENPYLSPSSNEPAVAEKIKKTLTVTDWVLACLMGVIAAIFVFPSTCLGVLVLFNESATITGGRLTLVVSSVFAIVAGIYITWLVLRARAK